MTLDDVGRITAYWRKYPPLRDLVAAFIGFKPFTPAEKPQHLNAEEFKALVSATNRGQAFGLSPAGR